MEQPRISLFKLAEYMVSGIDGRTAIVGQAVKANPAASRRYSRARRELVRIVAGPRPFDIPLVDAAQGLRDTEPQGDWDASDLRFCADAIDRFRQNSPSLHLGDRAPRPKRKWPKLLLENVSISVSPDLVVRKMAPIPQVGAVKFRLSSGRGMDAAEARYAASILHYFLKERLRDSDQGVSPALCQVVDVFSGRVTQAKSAYRRDIASVRKACVEFAAHWDVATRLDVRQTNIMRLQPDALH